MNLLSKISRLVDIEGLSVDDLAPYDHFHPQGIRATKDVADRLDIEASMKLLDLGCGIGGPARYFRNRFGCRVEGMDANAEYIEIGNEINRRLDLTTTIRLHCVDVNETNLGEAHFDGVLALHIMMNIEDKSSLLNRIYTTLKTDGVLVITQFYAINEADIRYPLPWADNREQNFLESKDVTLNTLIELGFNSINHNDLSKSYIKSYRKGVERIKSDVQFLQGLELMMPHNAKDCFHNTLSNLEMGAIGAIEIIAKKG